MKQHTFLSALTVFLMTGCAVNHLNEGLSAGQHQDYAVMLKHCSAATQQANADPLAFKCLGDAQLNLGHQELAEEAYLAYLNRRPDALDTRFAVINIAFNSGRYAAAQAQLEAVLNSQPGNLEALYLLGESHRFLGHCDAALLAYDKALQIDPNYQAPLLAKTKAEREICAVVKRKTNKPKPKRKIVKHKKFQAGGAALQESDW